MVGEHLSESKSDSMQSVKLCIAERVIGAPQQMHNDTKGNSKSLCYRVSYNDPSSRMKAFSSVHVSPKYSFDPIWNTVLISRSGHEQTRLQRFNV